MVQPQTGEDKKISLDYLTSLKILPALNEDQLIYVVVNIRAPQANAGPDGNLPLNLALVLDQSNSMRGEKLHYVKEAAHKIIEQLTMNDYFSLITFNDRPTVVVPNARISGRDSLLAAVESIDAKGGTELAPALAAGLREVKRHSSPSLLNHIILLTDGRTYGDEEECIKLIKEAKANQIVITPMGIGDEWNEDLLETMAVRSGSHSIYIRNAQEIVTVFKESILSLRSVFVTEATLSIALPQRVILKELWRVTPQMEDLSSRSNQGNITLNLGSFDKIGVQSLLLALIIPPHVPGSVPVATIQASMGSGKNVITSPMMGIDIQCRHLAQFPLADPSVRSIIERVTAFRLQSKAWEDLERGDIPTATKRLQMVATRLLNAGETELAQAVQEEADNLQSMGDVSPAGKKKIKYGTRGLATQVPGSLGRNG